MIISTAVIQGFKNEVSHKMFDFWGHIVVTDARADQSFELIPITKADSISDELRSIRRVEKFKMPSINDEGYKTVSTKSGIKMVHPFSVMPSIISRKDEFEGLLLKGVEKEFVETVIQPYLTQGSVIKYDVDDASRDMVISEQSSKRMKLSVGNRLYCSFYFG